VENIFVLLAIVIIGNYLTMAVKDILLGAWEGHAIMLGLILFGYGAMQAKYNQPHGIGMTIAGVVVVISSWIFVGVRSKR